jgi:hypothetical protein
VKQERHFDYVLGPNQDSRLASVAAGAEITEVLLTMDSDAPFVLTSRAVRCQRSVDGNFDQAPLQKLKVRWTGPERDYRMQDYLLESLSMAYFGQQGNPKPIVPSIVYPPNSVLMLDLQNAGASAITNLSFYFRGFKLYPEGAVPSPSYPGTFRTQTFSYPIFVSQLKYNETRLNQIFTVKTDADFVIRAGQGIPPVYVAEERAAARCLSEVSILLKDHQKNPYSNDFMPFDILMGVGAYPACVPLGPTPSLAYPFGTGPGQPGLFYPEIYIPANQQLLYDLRRAEAGTPAAEDFVFALIGSKVFTR